MSVVQECGLVCTDTWGPIYMYVHVEVYKYGRDS